MNPNRSLLLLSMVLNAALVAGVVYFLWPAKGPVATATATPRGELLPPAATAVDAVSEPPAVTMVTNRFQWRELESTDYEVFVANLRAVGCPEQTIRELVLADLRAACHARQRAESPAVPFWTGGLERARAVREDHEREVRVAAEFSALAQRLFGIDWHPDDGTKADLTEQAITRFLVGPLPEETFQKLCGVLQKFERSKSNLDEDQSGIELPEDRVVRERLRAQLQRELAALLSPAQLEEFTARVSAAPDGGGAMERDALDVSPAELRAICLARARHFDPLQNMLELEDPPEAEQELAQTRFLADVRTLLGEARFADFERSQDDDFLALYRTVHEAVGRPQIVKAYEVSRLAHAEAARLATDGSLDAAERQQRLAQIAALTESELRQTLGEKAFQQCRDGKLNLLRKVK